MKLSSHEEYGIRCLLQVARAGIVSSTTIAEISRSEGISVAYTAKLLRILRQRGFLKASRGKVGGYTLALPPESICVGDALAALGNRMYEEDFCSQHATGKRDCPHLTHCALRPLWRSLQDVIDRILAVTTVRDLLLFYENAADSHGLPSALTFLRSNSHLSISPPVLK